MMFCQPGDLALLRRRAEEARALDRNGQSFISDDLLALLAIQIPGHQGIPIAEEVLIQPLLATQLLSWFVGKFGPGNAMLFASVQTDCLDDVSVCATLFTGFKSDSTNHALTKLKDFRGWVSSENIPILRLALVLD